jgi:UDP-4-amino-4-deoxy-L-arabinose-oxoglutarate aminotransferase
MDVGATRAAVTARTRAVIPVHLYGQMVDIPALRRAVGAIPIIEDAAHCFEGRRNGRRPGQDGDIAIFSFYATKNVTCGEEGGAVVSKDKAFASALRETIIHGMSAHAVRRFQGGHYNHWDVSRLGTKANLPDLLAVLLGPQIATVEQRLEARERLAQRYEDRLAGTPFTIQRLDAGIVSARHLFPIGVPNGARDLALRVLADRGIGATVNYRSVTDLTLYNNSDLDRSRYPNSREWGNSTLSLPLFPGLTDEEQNYVLDVLLHQILPATQNQTSKALEIA